MYAVIEDSGSQYRVSEGDVIRVDLRDLSDGQDTIEFEKVLLVGGEDSPAIGTPYLDGAKVTAQVLGEERSEKITGMKFKRRQNYHRKVGHRQPYLRVQVTGIES